MQQVSLAMNEMEWIKAKLQENPDPNTYGGYPRDLEGLFMKIMYAIDREKQEIDTLKNSDK